MLNLKLFLIVLVGMFALYSQSLEAQEEYDFKQFERDVQTLQKRYQAPGLAIAVVKGDKVIYANGFGYRDLKNNLAVNSDTVFSIGSITKSFTSGMIGTLHKQNKISLDAHPKQYFPELVFNSAEMNEQIQIKDLLSHASGLGNLDGSLVLFPEKDKRSVLKRLPYLKQEGKTKDSWIYSNMGYSIVGALIEQTSQQTWQTYLHNTIFSPLAMENSYSSLTSMKKNSNYALAYAKVGNEIKAIPFEGFHANEPAGAIFSSVNDMSKWIVTWLNDGKFADRQVIPANYVKQAMQIQNVMPQQGADHQVFLFGDGYGWRMNSHKGHYKVHHGGNTSGFSAQLTMYPDKKLGLIALTNQTSSILPHLAIDMLSNQLLNLPQTPVEKYPVFVRPVFQVPESPTVIDEEKLPNKSIDFYAGKFEAEGFGTVTIRRQNNYLMIDFPELSFGLRHQNDHVFEMYAVSEFPRFFDPRYQLSFSKGKDQQITSFSIYLQSTPVTFKRVG